MGKNLSVFYIKDNGPETGTLNPMPDNKFTHINYFRPTNEANFLANPLNRFCQVQVISFPQAGVETDKTITEAPFCVVNRNGANASGAPLALFTLTTGGSIAWTNSTSNTTWSPWQTIQPPSSGIASGPAVATYVPDRMALIVRDSNGDLQRGFTNGTNWLGWITTDPLERPPGQVIAGEPAVIGFPDNDYRVYVRTMSNQLWYRDFNGTSLGAWTQIPNISPTGSPEGVNVDLNNETGSPLGVADQREGMNVFYPGPGSALELVRHTYSGNPPMGQFTDYNYGGVCSAPQKLDTKVPVLILTVVVVGEPTNVAHIQPG